MKGTNEEKTILISRAHILKPFVLFSALARGEQWKIGGKKWEKGRLDKRNNYRLIKPNICTYVPMSAKKDA